MLSMFVTSRAEQTDAEFRAILMREDSQAEVGSSGAVRSDLRALSVGLVLLQLALYRERCLDPSGSFPLQMLVVVEEHCDVVCENRRRVSQ